jgi:hypothetical protein
LLSEMRCQDFDKKSKKTSPKNPNYYPFLIKGTKFQLSNVSFQKKSTFVQAVPTAHFISHLSFFTVLGPCVLVNHCDHQKMLPLKRMVVQVLKPITLSGMVGSLADGTCSTWLANVISKAMEQSRDEIINSMVVMVMILVS